MASAVVVHIDRVPGTRALLFALFESKQWDKLPHLSVLQNDPEFDFLLRE